MPPTYMHLSSVILTGTLSLKRGYRIPTCMCFLLTSISSVSFYPLCSSISKPIYNPRRISPHSTHTPALTFSIITKSFLILTSSLTSRSSTFPPHIAHFDTIIQTIIPIIYPHVYIWFVCSYNYRYIIIF